MVDIEFAGGKLALIPLINDIKNGDIAAAINHNTKRLKYYGVSSSRIEYDARGLKDAYQCLK